MPCGTCRCCCEHVFSSHRTSGSGDLGHRRGDRVAESDGLGVGQTPLASRGIRTRSIGDVANRRRFRISVLTPANSRDNRSRHLPVFATRIFGIRAGDAVAFLPDSRDFSGILSNRGSRLATDFKFAHDLRLPHGSHWWSMALCGSTWHSATRFRSGDRVSHGDTFPLRRLCPAVACRRCVEEIAISMGKLRRRARPCWCATRCHRDYVDSTRPDTNNRIVFGNCFGDRRTVGGNDSVSKCESRKRNPGALASHLGGVPDSQHDFGNLVCLTTRHALARSRHPRDAGNSRNAQRPRLCPLWLGGPGDDRTETKPEIRSPSLRSI